LRRLASSSHVSRESELKLLKRQPITHEEAGILAVDIRSGITSRIQWQFAHGGMRAREF
jgi:hypothetical protein